MKKLLKKMTSGKKKEGEIEDIASMYDIGQEIGKGAFSIVREAINKETGERCAVKSVSKKYVAHKDLKLLEREIEIMKKLKHPNIVSLNGVVESEDEIYIIMELVAGGELFDHIVERGFYSEKEASILVKQLLNAVEFMHSHGVAHRDLKHQNLLCGEDGMTIKIADFGLSKMYEGGEELRTACGTPDYVAPEILLCKPYSKSVDIWSAGIITYILLCGFTPFYAETHKELFEKIMRSPFDFPDPEWTDISNEAKDFITKLLEKDPEKRITASQALKHPWLTGKAPSAKLARMDSFKDNLTKYTARTKVLSLSHLSSNSDDTLINEGLKE